MLYYVIYELRGLKTKGWMVFTTYEEANLYVSHLISLASEDRLELWCRLVKGEH